MGATAIILAAGKGTRMKSDTAKVLHTVCGRPMVAYVIDACRAAGCERLLVVVGHQAQNVRDAFAGDDADITWVEQREQLGTGHAVMVCRESLDRVTGPVLVLAGDGPLVRGETLRTLLDRHADAGAAVTLATSILDEPGRYGRIVRDADGALTGVVEYLDADADHRDIHEVNVSLYCFDAAALRSAVDRLDNANAKGEYYLTDAIGLLKADGATLAAVPAVPPEDVLSINTVEQLEQVERIMHRRLAATGG
ncbi:MAG: NTP transferase domain-containing protein [Phycisphaerae bacterium]|nr:NTP transferase domain-containing protein [Phycisphaerae bacterium]